MPRSMPTGSKTLSRSRYARERRVVVEGLGGSRLWRLVEAAPCTAVYVTQCHVSCNSTLNEWSAKHRSTLSGRYVALAGLGHKHMT